MRHNFAIVLKCTPWEDYITAVEEACIRPQRGRGIKGRNHLGIKEELTPIQIQYQPGGDQGHQRAQRRIFQGCTDRRQAVGYGSHGQIGLLQ